MVPPCLNPRRIVLSQVRKVPSVWCLIWIKRLLAKAHLGSCGCQRGETMALNVFGQTGSGDEIIQMAVRLGLLAFLLYWSFVLVRPFIPILAWSLVLTVALYQPYEWLSLRLGGRPKLAAVIVTVTCLLIIIGPATWLGLGMIDGLQNFAGQLGTGTLTIPSPPEGVKDWPLLGAQI